MKINSNYKIRRIHNENLVVKQGGSHADMTKVISLNDTAVVLWEALAGKDFGLADAAKVLTERYGIDEERALADAKKWADKLTEGGVIEA